MAGRPPRSERARRPFWLHQAAEYLLGIVLVAQGLQMPDPVVPTVAGALVMLNAATAIGPLGAFRLAGRKAHRVADLAVLGIIVSAALQPWVFVDAGSRGIMLVVAGVLGVVWYYTDFAERPERARRRVAQAGPRSEQIGRSAGRAAGGFVSGWKQRNQEQPPGRP
jgi:hypothetical protein